MSEQAVRQALTAYGVTDPSKADRETLSAVIDLAVVTDVLDGHWVDTPGIGPDAQYLIDEARRREAAANLEAIQLQNQIADSLQATAEAEQSRLRPLIDAWQQNNGIRRGAESAPLRVVFDDNGQPAALRVADRNAPASDSVEDVLKAWRETYG